MKHIRIFDFKVLSIEKIAGLLITTVTSINCNGDRYRCSPNVPPHLVSGVIIVYVIDNTALLQQAWYGH
jgi:hypothetical protein